MIEQTARVLFQEYVDGWKQNDLQKIISCLTRHCMIIESHGPTYQGIADVEMWFQFWMAANSKVIRWDISSFYFCELKNTAFAEWDFACTSSFFLFSLKNMHTKFFCSS